MKSKMTVAELPVFVTKALSRGDRVVMTVKRKSKGGPRNSGWWKPIATLDFKLGELATEGVVRIPCVIVPPSPFHKAGPVRCTFDTPGGRCDKGAGHFGAHKA